MAVKKNKQKKPLSKSLMRVGANTISAARPVHALYIGHEILTREDYHGWDMSAHILAAGGMDKVDGWLGRAAGSTKVGETLDQLADKGMTHLLLGSLALRAMADDDTNFAKFIFTNQVLVASRDLLVTKKRREAKQFGISTKAQPLGKYKTGMTNVALAGLVSPYAKTTEGRNHFATMLAGGTGLSVVSGISMNNYLNTEIKSHKTQIAPEMPMVSSAIEQVFQPENKNPLAMAGALTLAAFEVAEALGSNHHSPSAPA